MFITHILASKLTYIKHLEWCWTCSVSCWNISGMMTIIILGAGDSAHLSDDGVMPRVQGDGHLESAASSRDPSNPGVSSLGPKWEFTVQIQR